MNTIILNTANDVLIHLEEVSLRLSNGGSVQHAKEGLKVALVEAKQGLSGVQVQVPIGAPATPEWEAYTRLNSIEAVIKCRSRSDLVTELDSLIAYIRLLPIGQTEEPVTNRLEELEEIITKELEQAANSSINVGLALLEAREEFDKQQDFLVWTSDRFAIKKSQAFNLMKVAKTFGNDKRFEGVAMRVLNLLAGESDEVKGQAAQLAAEGKLTTPALQAITGGKPSKPVITDDEGNTLEEPEEVTEAAKAEDLPPFEVDTPKAATSQPVSPEASAIAKLTAQITKLLEENEKLVAQLANAGKSKVTKSLPLLPHFTSKCYATRLGLTQEDATQKNVRAAYREITKHYTPETNAEAFELLTEALDFITKEIKAA